MCPYCLAQRDGPHSWKDFSLDAQWLRTCRDHAAYLRDMQQSKASNFQKGLSPFAFESKLAQVPYFSWSMVKLDFMHAADLGILGYELGEIWWSILPDMASAHHQGNSRTEGFEILKQELKEYYKQHKITSKLPLKRFSLTKIKSVRRKPKLKAKAAQARKLVPFTLNLCSRYKHQNPLGEHRY
eukprot:3471720-Karenia_brevis.AAC.1